MAYTFPFIKNTDNKLVCQFCNNACIITISSNWCCEKCKVYFYESDSVIQLEYKQYIIIIYLIDKSSALYTYHDRDGYKLITTFNCLLNITPETFPDKLKTYLLLL